MVKTADKARTLPKTREVPTFASEDEERAWWASHDTSELPGEDVVLTYAEPTPASRPAGARHTKGKPPLKRG